MKAKLSAREKDLLQRIDEKKDLRPLFFRKVKGLKWFDPLFERGYFSPEANPKPEPSEEKGYVNIPLWPAIGYLFRSATELTKNSNREYANKILEIIVTTTIYAKKHNFSNYRTWWQFSQIISKIPSEIISCDDIDIVDYWLDDKYDHGLVAQEIGKVWLPKLLETNDNHDLQLASKLIGFLYRVVFIERRFGESIKREPSLRFDHWHAREITKKVAHLAGVKLGSEVISIFDSQLKFILNELKNDAWSYIWQPAIGEHEQNKYRNDAENIFVEAYRDSLNGYMVTMPKKACEYLANMLGENYQTIQRLAIHVLNQNSHLCQNLLGLILNAKFLASNFRHEMWHFLNRNYQQLIDDQKRSILNLIQKITSKDEEGNFQEGVSAYNRAIWLAAIKNHDKDLDKLYKHYVSIANRNMSMKMRHVC